MCADNPCAGEGMFRCRADSHLLSLMHTCVCLKAGERRLQVLRVLLPQAHSASAQDESRTQAYYQRVQLLSGPSLIRSSHQGCRDASFWRVVSQVKLPHAVQWSAVFLNMFELRSYQLGPRSRWLTDILA